jgi:opacity protein-like surface antigen
MPAGAESADDTALDLKPGRHRIWKGEIGSGFRKNQLHAGMGFGAGYGAKILGSLQSHDLALAAAHFGWIFTDVILDDFWFRGNGELLAELYGGEQFGPNKRYVFGLALLPRYNFVTGTRLVPFIDGGLGIAYTNIEEPDLSTKFQFIVQGGAGTHYFVRTNLSVTAQYRFFHLSNAGIRKPNRGANTHMFFASFSWFF